MNLPWTEAYCGYDFGPPPPGWRSRHPSPRSFEELAPRLAELRAVGVDLVRFFVLADARTAPPADVLAARVDFGRGREAAVAAGASLPSAHPLMLADLRALLDRLNEAGLEALPSFLSFEAFFPRALTKDGVPTRGRRALLVGDDPLTGAAARDAFFDAYLEPMLALAGPEGEVRHPAVHAWEVVNEPDWCVRKREVSGEAMSAFLIEGVRRVVARGHVASIGFVDGTPTWLTDEVRRELDGLAALGRYFAQRHHYPARRRKPLPDVSGLPPHARPVLGEFAMARGPETRWPDEALAEDDPERYLEARLRLVERAGYRTALLWSLVAKDAQSGWDAGVARQLARFAGRGAADPPVG